MLIPGLGADAGLFRPQREFFGNRLVVPPWIEAEPEESLSSYARRLGRTLDLPRPFWIGGISFGGMMAAEIAEERPDDIAGLVLIGACTDRRQITLPFRLAAKLGPRLPRGIVRGMLNRVVPTLFAAAEGVSNDPLATSVLDEVAYRTDVSQLTWGARAIANWTGGAEPKVPTFRAHGRSDAVIPMRESDFRPGVDLVIEGGRHLIHLTHHEIVNRWIASKLDAPDV